MKLIKGNGAPSSKTIGNKNDIYIDVDNDVVYECFGTNNPGRDLGFVITYNHADQEYVWKTVGVDVDALIAGTITELKSGAEVIGENIFQNYSALTSVEFPNATTIGDQAFMRCFALTSVEFPNATTVGNAAFQQCSALTSVEFPNATTICGSAFNNCSALTSVDFPNATTIGDNAFQSCSALASVRFPNATSAGTWVFQNCLTLASVDLPKVTYINSFVFMACRSLTSLILRSESLCSLSSGPTFTECFHFHGTVDATYNPDGLKDGYIYVPSALIEDYKVATNWVSLASQFRALEDYTVDGTVTGALDPNKI